MLKKVFLDLGHGEGNGPGGIYDPGAISDGYTEHGLVAKQVRRIVNEIQPCVPELVLMPELSRTDVVTYVNGLHEDGDCLLSLHMNASAASSANGVEVIIATTAPKSEREPQAYRLGHAVSRVLGTRFRRVITDRESPRGYLTVLRQTAVPAFMLEAGFITNEADRNAFMERGAEAIVAGLTALRNAIHE